jgi:hypothetical protein
VHALLILAATFALAASSARAPSAEEQRLYDDGLRAFQAGDARAAEKAWKAGYAAGHDPAFLVHIGEAQEKAGAPAEAADTYRHYLREAPDAADRVDIEQRIARLAPAAAPAAAPPAAPAPAETPGEFGGTPPAPDLHPPVAQHVDNAPAAAPGNKRPTGPTPEDTGWNRYNITAVATASAAALALGVAGLFAAEVASDEDDIRRLVNFRDQTHDNPLQYSAIARQYEQAMADGPRHARYAKIALGISLVTAAVSATFFVLDARLGAEPAIAVAPDGHGVVATGGVRWSF